jgi:hypothetical protein
MAENRYANGIGQPEDVVPVRVNRVGSKKLN